MKQFDFRMDDGLLEFPLFAVVKKLLTAYNDKYEELQIDEYQELKEEYTAYYNLLSIYKWNPYSEQEHWFIIRDVYSQKGIENSLQRYGKYFGLSFSIEWEGQQGENPVIKVEISQESYQQIISFSLFQRLIEKLVAELLYYTSLQMDYGDVNLPYDHVYESQYYKAQDYWNNLEMQMVRIGGAEVPRVWRSVHET